MFLKASEFLAKFNKENKKSVNNGSVNNQTIVKVTNEPKIQKDLNIIRRERSCENRTSRLRASSISRNLNNKSSSKLINEYLKLILSSKIFVFFY